MLYCNWSNFQFTPVVPGTYTVAIHYSTGCCIVPPFRCCPFRFPTFSTQSPQNFTLGCNSKSVTSIIIPNGQTSPRRCASLFISAANATNAYIHTVPIASVSLAGTWTVIVRDSLTGCETRVPTGYSQYSFATTGFAYCSAHVRFMRPQHEVTKSLFEQHKCAINWSFPSVRVTFKVKP